MSTQIQRRRGTTAQHSTFTGANAELTVDTDKEVVVVHDGTTAGGNPLMREDASNSALALGSAATPSLKWDANTGIYSPGADQVAVATNGVGRLFVDASGNVDLKCATNQNSTLRLYPNGTAVYAGAQFFNSAGSQGAQLLVASGSEVFLDSGGNGSINYRASGTGTHVWFTNGAQKATIDSSGRLGIGTSAPSSLLHISGPGGSSTSPIVTATTGTNYIGQKFANTGGSFWLAIDNNIGSSFLTNTAYSRVLWSDGAYPICFSTNSVERVRISATGNVGIGVTGPLARLHSSVDNSIYSFGATGTTKALRIRHDTETSAIEGVDITLGASYQPLSLGGSYLAFATGGSEKARIDSSGRLLIGTSTAQGQSIFQAVGNSSASTDPGDIRVIRGLVSFIGSNVGAELGIIKFGALENSVCAQISAVCDANWSTNDFPGRLVFSTTSDSASSPTERMRITSTGQLRLAGAGITFNGDTATANELDDYEEGTWTPSLGGTATYTVQHGNYTKVGRLVNIRCNITVNLIGTGSTFQISGLPFTPATTATGNPNAFGVVGFFQSLAVSPVYISTFAASGGTTINVTGLTAAGATASPALGVFGNSARIDFTMTYYVG